MPQNATAIYQSGSSYNYNYSTVRYSTLRYATLYTHHYTTNKYDYSNSNDKTEHVCGDINDIQ